MFLVHDRPIHRALRRLGRAVPRRRPTALRRARGYAPGAIALPVAGAAPMLAVGGRAQEHVLPGVAAATRSSRQHIGDLDTTRPTCRASRRRSTRTSRRCSASSPSVVAHDLHPDYLSTTWALERSGCRAIGVQHHHAHVAACLAEHGLDERGARARVRRHRATAPTATLWGGELLRAISAALDAASAGCGPSRCRAARRRSASPWRVARRRSLERPASSIDLLRGCVAATRRPSVSARQLERGPARRRATGAGPLFDAVAALLGVCATRQLRRAGGDASSRRSRAPRDEPGRRCPCGLVDGSRSRSIYAPWSARSSPSCAGGAARAIAGARFHATLARWSRPRACAIGRSAGAPSRCSRRLLPERRCSTAELAVGSSRTGFEVLLTGGCRRTTAGSARPGCVVATPR